MITTPLTQRLGISAPVIQAPIGPWPELVAAVSNAGGLGMLQASWLHPATLRDAIRATRERTNRPFAINLALHENRESLLDTALEEGVSIVTLTGGDLEPYAARAHEGSATVAYAVGSARDALQAMDAGADIIVAQSWEAGGHVHSQVAGLTLIPSVKDAVGDTPVVAAGGIADGRGLAAALALGADAIWMGTRFVASEEARFTTAYKQDVVAADEAVPVLTTLFDVGWPDSPHRVLPTATFARWQEAGSPRTGDRPGEGDIVAVADDGEPLPRYGIAEPTIDMTGDLEALAQYAGQSAGLVDTIESAAIIVRNTVAQAQDILRRLNPDTDLTVEAPLESRAPAVSRGR